MYIRLRNRHIVLILFLLLQGIVYARGYQASTAVHHIGMSVGGGEANDLAKNLHTLPGAAGNITLFYEMQKNRIMVSIGVEAQFQYTRDSLDAFVNEFKRTDIMGAVNYQYIYSNWFDKQTDLRVAIPLRVGYQPNDYLYFMAGADVSIALMAQHTTTATMYTQGVHAWDSKPMQTDDLTDFSANLGYYKSSEYSTTAPYTENIWVAPALEIGSYIPLKSKKSKLRVGAYANYGIRIGKHPNSELVDYSAIDMSANPNSQSQSFLQNNLVLNSALNSNRWSSMPGNLEVGLRITYLLELTTHKKICMCMPY